MSPECEHEFLAKFPHLFAGWVSATGESETRKHIDCGDGWLTLLDVLCEALQWETDHATAPQLVARRVKEKLGGLRFQAGRGSDAQSGMILLATRLSERICEICGAPGTLVCEGGLIAVRCKAHDAHGASA